MVAKELLPHYNGQVVEICAAGAAYTLPAVPSLPGLLEQGREVAGAGFRKQDWVGPPGYTYPRPSNRMKA